MGARLIKSFWKRLWALFSTLRARKDTTSNSDQNVDGIAPSIDCQEDFDGLERLWHPEWETFPKVTISATIETGQVESTIKVPKQRSYTGREPVIPSSLADIPCATLGVQGVLDRLNVTLGTSHTLDTPSVLSILEDCIVKNYDFGTAYGRLRSVWIRNNDRTIEDELRTREDKDKECRRKVPAGPGDLLWTPMPPRRVWDLYSNRVVPWWMAEEWPLPISHAWVDEKDRMDVWTPINGNEWPVPIPKDASLDLIRIELLNLGVDYVWLDVLCLRQKGGPREDLRVDEWKLDVPTIGNMYKWARVVVYLSGLGRALSLKDGDLESDHCWFRRAWTLQEVGEERIIAGDTPDGPMHTKPVDDNGNYKTEILTRFHKQLEHLQEITSEFRLFETLVDMRNRVSTNPVDRVAGLAFCLQANHAYHEKETLEDAWTALVNAMDAYVRARILLLYPGAGLGSKKWRPTWEQVMSEPLPADDECYKLLGRDDEMDEDWYEGPCIKQGFVRGLNTSAEGVDRRGELVVKDADWMQHTFKILATHKFLIPEGPHTLLGAFFTFRNPHQEVFQWVVGRSLPDQRFEKLSVITVPDEGERERLRQCGFVQWGLKTYLL